jgi:hypothetical protein
MTPKQIAARRANGQKSHGPTTTAGKAKSRYNALKHGIHAESQIMFDETAEDLAELAAELHELYSPADATERFLVDTLINNEWRLRRLRSVDADLWQTSVNTYLEKHTEIERASSGDAFATSGTAFERLQRIVALQEASRRLAIDNRELVGVRLIDSVDDQHVHRSFARLQLEPKLFLHGAKEITAPIPADEEEIVTP